MVCSREAVKSMQERQVDDGHVFLISRYVYILCVSSYVTILARLHIYLELGLLISRYIFIRSRFFLIVTVGTYTAFLSLSTCTYTLHSRAKLPFIPRRRFIIVHPCVSPSIRAFLHHACPSGAISFELFWSLKSKPHI